MGAATTRTKAAARSREAAGRRSKALRVYAAPAPSQGSALGEVLATEPEGGETRSIVESFPPPALRLLVVDDEPGIRQALEIAFRREGRQVVTAAGRGAAVEAITSSPRPFPLVITDLAMPDGSGLEVLRAAKERDAASEVIVITAHSTVENAIEAMRLGAYDFVRKPFDPAELSALVAKALEKHELVSEVRRLRAREDDARPGVVARSRAMTELLSLVERIAATRTTVLLTGESGTGKERLARAIHDASDRSAGPFLVVNCGALPEALMESELFGHEKGAFTGAQARHRGLFREAHGGTLLLDEVGELPLSLQVKLLRVLQERAVRPVGAAQETPVDVRLLAATNRDVESDVAAGRFRQDLYYRLNVIRLRVPPLRERREDVPVLVERFVRRFAGEMGKDVTGLSADALRALEGYAFPGNVRELENVIERAVALAATRVIGLGDLPPEISGAAGAVGARLGELPDAGCDLDQVLAEVERRLLVEALDRTGGVRKAAARLLGITFRSMRYRLEKHQLDPGGADDDAEPPASLEGG
ncbi:MAG: sigma-54-dependent Fis family transcriptional regulator [Polyangiaceae bacterium]|nr:sigma-54-dependent Fis family transcriptional regulator [Polyangiaceae bacterium]